MGHVVVPRRDVLQHVVGVHGRSGMVQHDSDGVLSGGVLNALSVNDFHGDVGVPANPDESVFTLL